MKISNDNNSDVKKNEKQSLVLRFLINQASKASFLLSWIVATLTNGR